MHPRRWPWHYPPPSYGLATIDQALPISKPPGSHGGSRRPVAPCRLLGINQFEMIDGIGWMLMVFIVLLWGTLGTWRYESMSKPIHCSVSRVIVRVLREAHNKLSEWLLPAVLFLMTTTLHSQDCSFQAMLFQLPASSVVADDYHSPSSNEYQSLASAYPTWPHWRGSLSWVVVVAILRNRRIRSKMNFFSQNALPSSTSSLAGSDPGPKARFRVRNANAWRGIACTWVRWAKEDVQGDPSLYTSLCLFQGSAYPVL